MSDGKLTTNKAFNIFIDSKAPHVIEEQLRSIKIPESKNVAVSDVKAFSSLVFASTEYANPLEFDLSINNAELDGSLTDNFDFYRAALSYLDYYSPPETTTKSKIIQEWKNYYNEIVDASPCIINFGAKTKLFVNSRCKNRNLSIVLLKFVATYTLLTRFRRNPIRSSSGFPVYEPEIIDLEFILNLMVRIYSPLNGLSRNSLLIIEFAKKFNKNSTFDRKTLIEELKFGSTAIHDAIKPLEKTGILTFDVKGSAHKKSYKLALDISKAKAIHKINENEGGSNANAFSSFSE